MLVLQTYIFATRRSQRQMFPPLYRRQTRHNQQSTETLKFKVETSYLLLDCLEIWKPQPLGTLWACNRPYRNIYIYINIYIYQSHYTQRVARHTQCCGFEITLRHTTLGRTPLDEGTARRRNLSQHTALTTDIHVPSGIRTRNPRLRTHGLDRAATGIGTDNLYDNLT
jgi:hypothetical protein